MHTESQYDIKNKTGFIDKTNTMAYTEEKMPVENARKGAAIMDDKNIEQDREYFQKLWEYHRPDGMKHTAEIWDNRAGEWSLELETDTSFRRKLDERVKTVTEYLEKQGVLKTGSDVIDIGSGSGRFVVEFAKRAGHATGIDISPEMLNLGKRYAESEGAANTSFIECDFKQADIDAYGWRKQFDLVFSSMSPAAGNLNALEKMIAMSKGYCFNCSPILEEDELKNLIEHTLSGKGSTRESLWSHRHFYSLFNLLWLDGYLPITSYHTQEVEEKLEITESLISYYTSHFERRFPQIPNLERRILKLLMENTNTEGRILQKSRHLYGWILWDVNKKRG